MRALIVIIVLVVLFVVLLGWVKYQGVRAFSTEHIVVDGLSIEQIAQIGVKKSGSLAARLVSGSTSDARVRRTAQGLEWEAHSKAGVMNFRVSARAGRNGVEVSAWASKQTLSQRQVPSRGTYALATEIVNALFRMLGVPRNPGYLLRQRRRVLRAIAAAGDGGAGGRR